MPGKEVSQREKSSFHQEKGMAPFWVTKTGFGILFFKYAFI